MTFASVSDNSFAPAYKTAFCSWGYPEIFPQKFRLSRNSQLNVSADLIS